MSSHIYVRKSVDGGYASPHQGSPTLNARIMSALPGKTFVVRCAGPDLTVVFDDTLTAGEETSLNAAYDAWTPSSRRRFEAIVKRETVSIGKITQVDWYEDAARTKLAKREVRNISGTPPRWLSTVTTEYYTDGGVASTKTETYTTLGDGSIVTEVS